MQLLPAIDIRGGRCVRLTQGDYSRETVFADDPTKVALRWQEQGALRLHVVDLDGAREGRPVNTDSIERILNALTIPIQLGGGLRDLQTLRLYADKGVDWLILGSAALKDRSFLAEALAAYGARIAVAVDSRNGFVASEGWLDQSQVSSVDLIAELAALGIPRIVYTDVLQDGTLSGPNFAGVEAVIAVAGSCPVVASGGVSGMEDLTRLASLGVEGVIVGKALYTGQLDLVSALAAVRDL